MADMGIIHGIIDCPCCGGENVAGELRGESHSWDHDYEYYDMRCDDCGAEWMLEYDDGEWYIEGDYDEEVTA